MAITVNRAASVSGSLPLEDSSSHVALSKVRSTRSLWSLNNVLTEAMADRSIQALVRGQNLDLLVEKVVSLSVANADDQLVAASILGRLVAVVRGDRALAVRDRVREVFTKEPADIDSLQDGDMKAHAASVLEYVDAPWCESYLSRQAVLIDAADNARRELLAAHLRRSGTLEQWVHSIAEESAILHGVRKRARSRRVYRVLAAMHEVVRQWHGEVGNDAGQSIAVLMTRFLKKDDFEHSEDTSFQTIDCCLAILVRAVELRFSLALSAKTYICLRSGVQLLGVGLWNRLLRNSSMILRVRETLLEAVLILARQNRTDGELAELVIRAYPSPGQAKTAVGRRLQGAKDLDAQVAKWWAGLGRTQVASDTVEQPVGRSADEMIGELLIAVEASRSAMEMVARGVVPVLEISDPVSAETARSATSGFAQIDQAARRLARLRRLHKPDLVGRSIEYNPLEHDLVDGHRPGIRSARVVRDGVVKDFAGRTKTVVKPWVAVEV